MSYFILEMYQILHNFFYDSLTKNLAKFFLLNLPKNSCNKFDAFLRLNGTFIFHLKKDNQQRKCKYCILIFIICILHIEHIKYFHIKIL